MTPDAQNQNQSMLAEALSSSNEQELCSDQTSTPFHASWMQIDNYTQTDDLTPLKSANYLTNHQIFIEAPVSQDRDIF